MALGETELYRVLGELTKDKGAWEENIPYASSLLSHESVKIRAKAARHLVNLVRYADDFVVTAKTPGVAAEVRGIIEAFLSERGLELSEEKTLVTHIDDGFDFLGWNFRKYDGKLLVRPSKKSVASFVREMHRCILRDSGSMGQDELVRFIGPKIRGFANYHRHVCSAATFSKIDHLLYAQLERWACRRHPRKHKGWIYKRYWFRRGGNKYVFGTEQCYLPHMAWQHIVRHPQIRAEANPYLDPDYFNKRKPMLTRLYANSFRLPTATNG